MGGWLAILGSSVWIGERNINTLTSVRIADEVNPILEDKTRSLHVITTKAGSDFALSSKEELGWKLSLDHCLKPEISLMIKYSGSLSVYLFSHRKHQEYFRNRQKKMRPSQRLDTHLHRTTYMQVSRPPQGQADHPFWILIFASKYFQGTGM